MKTILKHAKTAPEYPRLKCIIHQGTVVDVALFTSDMEGTILYHVDPTMIGAHYTDLNIDVYVDYNDELVLKN